MGYLKQHCFTVDNVKEFFLSPYTYIVNTEQALYIGREDDRREFCIEEPYDCYEELFHSLSEGMDVNELKAFFDAKISDETWEEFYEWLIVGGIVE